jgi:hypothetical protein
MIISKEPAYVVGHAGNLIGPADALLVLEVTMDTGQRLTSASGPRRNTSHQLPDQRPRPATQSEAPQARACQCLRSEWHRRAERPSGRYWHLNLSTRVLANHR